MKMTLTRRKVLLCCSAAAIWEISSRYALGQESEVDAIVQEHQQSALTNTEENDFTYSFDLGLSVRSPTYSEMSTLQAVATETNKAQSYLTAPTGGYSEEKWTRGLLKSGQSLMTEVSASFNEMRGEVAAKTLDFAESYSKFKTLGNELRKLPTSEFMKGTEQILGKASKLPAVADLLTNGRTAATKEQKLAELYVSDEVGGFAGGVALELFAAASVAAVVTVGATAATALVLEGPGERMYQQATDAAAAALGTFMQQLEVQMCNWSIDPLSVDPMSDMMMRSYPGPFSN